MGAVLFSALLETKLSSDTWLKPMTQGKWGIIGASVLGGLLPGCACATVPLAENLRRNHAGLGVTAAFLLVSPLLSSHTILLTYGFLGLKFTVWRVVTAMVGAMVLGYMLEFCEKKQWVKLPALIKKTCCSNKGCTDVNCSHLGFWEVVWITTKKLGGYFFIGIFLASVLTVLVPADLIPNYMGKGAMAYIVAVVVGIPVYVCEGEEIPLTHALLQLNMGVGPAFTFMMGAVGTCIPTMLMARAIIGGQALVVYILYWFVFAVGAGILFAWL